MLPHYVVAEMRRDSIKAIMEQYHLTFEQAEQVLKMEENDNTYQNLGGRKN